MALQIQIKRGAAASLPALASGEFAITTNTNAEQLYIGTAAGNKLVARVLTGASLPVFSATLYPLTTLFYIPSLTETGVDDEMYVSDGTAWRKIGTVQLADMLGSLDDIADGTTYAKVLATQITSGKINSIRAVTATTDITGDTIKTHLDSTSNPHSTTLAQAVAAGATLAAIDINFNNNTGTNVKDPVNAQDIANKRWVSSQISTAQMGAEFQDSVISIRNAPGTQTNGFRYLVGTSPSGVWVGHNNEIAEWDTSLTGGADWVYTTPTVGMFVGVDADASGLYYYGGASWTLKEWENTTAGVGLTKGTTDLNVVFENEGTGDATTDVLVGTTAQSVAGVLDVAARADHVHALTAIDCGEF
jgi:hypothetical protein